MANEVFSQEDNDFINETNEMWAAEESESDFFSMFSSENLESAGSWFGQLGATYNGILQTQQNIEATKAKAVKDEYIRNYEYASQTPPARTAGIDIKKEYLIYGAVGVVALLMLTK